MGISKSDFDKMGRIWVILWRRKKAVYVTYLFLKFKRILFPDS